MKGIYIYTIMEFGAILVITVKDARWSCDADRRVRSRLTFWVEDHSEVSNTSAACREERSKTLTSGQESCNHLRVLKAGNHNYGQTRRYWTVWLDSAGGWPSSIIPLDGWKQAERQSRGQVVTQLILHHSLLQQ